MKLLNVVLKKWQMQLATCNYLNINDENASEQITEILATNILNASGGDKLVNAYEQKFKKIYVGSK